MKKIPYNIYPAFLLLLLSFNSCSDMERDFEPELVKYPPISIEDFSPKEGLPGTEVRITGTHFGDQPQAVSVFFNGVEADSIHSVADTEIVVSAPPGAGSGKIIVKVWTHTDSVSTDFKYLPAPEISKIEPATGTAGDYVTISGSNFETVPEGLKVLFKNNVEAEIVSMDGSEIIVVVPEGGITGPVSLQSGRWKLDGPVFSYPLIGLDAGFETPGDAEGWLPQQNASYQVSGGKLNVTFDPAQFTPGSKRRADLKLEGGTEIHAGSFPILAIKMDKPREGNLIFDTNLGRFGNGNNKWTGILAGDVYYFDLSQTGFGPENILLPATETTVLSTFQFKIADITSNEEGYSVDWIKSFESLAALKEAVALPEGKYIFEFDNADDKSWLPAQNASYEISGGALNVTFDPIQFEGTNKRRADLQYVINGALNGVPKAPWIYSSSYPILAIKYTKPEGGVLKPDMTGGDLGNNTYKEDFIEQDVYYYDLSEKFTGSREELPTFQFKIADITSPETGYQVDWIRTFGSVEELSAFINSN